MNRNIASRSATCRLSFLSILLLALCGSSLGALKKTSGGGKSGTLSSKVVCKASASAKKWEYAKGAFTEAVLRSIKAICSPNYDGTVMFVKKACDRDHGFAFASALAAVSADCTYKGKHAYGCAAASAWATAWSDAWVVGTAIVPIQEIIAENCACGVGAEVAAFGVAKIVAKIFATASAHADTVVCRSGKSGSNSGSAFTYCFGSIMIDLYSRAVAKYMYKTAGCHTKAVAEADLTIIAEVEAEYESDYACWEEDKDPLPCHPFSCKSDSYGWSYAAVWEF